jgi:hypothetical protein
MVYGRQIPLSSFITNPLDPSIALNRGLSGSYRIPTMKSSLTMRISLRIIWLREVEDSDHFFIKISDRAAYRKLASQDVANPQVVLLYAIFQP